MNPIGIDHLGLFGMPPTGMIALAEDLDCQSIGIVLSPRPGYDPDGHAHWSLRDDAALRRETIAASRDSGVRIGLVDGFLVMPDQDVRSFASDLDLTAELGGERINALSVGKDMRQAIDGFGILCEMAAERGILVSAEMGSLGPLDRVAPSLEVVRGVGAANLTLLIDTMHFFRLGNTMADFAALDPALVGYVQLADAPWAPRFDTYMEEALYERTVPGEGELPLAEFLALVPEDRLVSIEIPLRSLAEAGIGARERTRRCVEAARTLMGQA